MLAKRNAAKRMSLVQIYQCLCDVTRLRILNLLCSGELCVCHFQEILGEPQVKVSKHLAYLRNRGLVESRKEANWMIYRLPSNLSDELSANLGCLQDCVTENPVFCRDGEKRRRLASKFTESSPACCAPKTRKSKALTSRP
jgi:ArsR family transcriptional regulator, arsenate/arsenite/antimonite-responsive transcriptional repressor